MDFESQEKRYGEKNSLKKITLLVSFGEAKYL